MWAGISHSTRSAASITEEGYKLTGSTNGSPPSQKNKKKERRKKPTRSRLHHSNSFYHIRCQDGIIWQYNPQGYT